MPAYPFFSVFTGVNLFDVGCSFGHARAHAADNHIGQVDIAMENNRSVNGLDDFRATCRIDGPTIESDDQ